MLEANKEKIPKLRFFDFRGDWVDLPLSKRGRIVGGGTPDTTNPKYWGGEIDWYTPTEIKHKCVRGSSRRISTIGLENSSAKLLPIGTILFTSRATIGRSSITVKECATNQGFQSIVSNNDNSNVFIYYWLSTQLNNFLKRAIGSTFPEITNKEMSRTQSIFPSLPEQQKIADFLSSVDTWIENIRAQKEALESYKKGIMQKIFSQEIRFKDDKGNDFPGWEEKRLGEIFYSEKGEGLSKDAIDDKGENECILYGELYTTYKEVVFSVTSRTNNASGLRSQIGDLLIPCSTTTAGIDLANVTALNKKGVLLGGDITVLRSKDKIDNVFYAYYLSNFKKREIASYAQGSTIVHLYYGHFKKMIIDLPSYVEQQKIAAFLTSIDKIIGSKQQKIVRAKQWKKGLMQGLFV